ncbi:Uma2 family endonuclease [Oscillatoria salina]|uniref:Uma2 family endonuclease n=1 Tax=Oscillatoria salina TaxID=331517 RepID=UPI001CC911C2|nr:Uma2 family endonuclease [Oscillatoria salina]MBZ8180552.1 Uma2 family endonuclease [Oscillatoria salina IIICB1]
MVTITSTPNQNQNAIQLKGVSWHTYKMLLSDVGENRAWRITYDQGVLELRMPSLPHEVPKGLLESFIEATVDELEIEILKAGALTLERDDLARAIEPDSCFYIQNEAQVRGKQSINLLTDPPPDLAIESDYTNSSINKLSVYAALGVPEVWRYNESNLEVYILSEGKYELAQESLAFPFLPIAEIPALIEQSQNLGQRATVRLFRARIREILAN